MTQFIFLVVLASAFLDALLHCMIKASRDAFSMSLIVAMMGGLVALPVLAATGLPDPSAYPWLVASVALGCLYWLVLGWAYQTNTLAMVFPVSRGTAVLLTTLGASFLMHETLSQLEAMMVLAVIAGLAIIASNGLRGSFSVAGLAPTLAVAVVTSSFMLVDASGVRVSNSAAAYCAVLYIGNAIGIGLYAALYQRSRLALFGPTMMMPALGISALSITTYILLLYAFARAPAAIVAALAETSIIFAAFFGIFWLREPARFGQMAGVAVVASGVVFLRLAN